VVTVLVTALALQGVIVYLVIAVAFPDWRPAFLGGASQEPPIPGRLVAAPTTPGTDPQAISPTDAATSRMLFGSPGSAVLGNRVPTAPRPAPAATSGAAMSTPHQPSLNRMDTPSPAAQLAFERYLDWLRSVELERQGLRAWGERHLPKGLSPSATEPAQQRPVLRLARQEVNAFRQRIVRTKPIVPPDCRIVDQYYMGAIAREGTQTSDFLDALGYAGDTPTGQIDHHGTGGIDRDLTIANARLEQTFRKRGLPATLRLEMGPDASLLGILTTQHGLR
jgi:hypothetical protein